MIRLAARCFLPALLVLGAIVAVEAQPAATTGSGILKKVDAKSGTVTIEVPVANKKKKDESQREFILAADAAVTIVVDGVKKVLKGKEALEGGLLKTGERVTYKAQGELKIVELTVGEGAKKK